MHARPEALLNVLNIVRVFIGLNGHGRMEQRLDPLKEASPMERSLVFARAILFPGDLSEVSFGGHACDFKS